MKLYRIFIPKTYDTKIPVPMEIIGGIASEIEERFGGYSLDPFTHLPVIQGSWKDGDGLKYKEEHFLLELFLEDTFENKKWIEAYKEMIRQKLKQKEIFILEINAETV
ncbi:hypothetical protein CMI37_26610 [Candidatus Pacearchaeota archaeon]|nr:hypothetical protein [Candidatus Pacearchaeota archaeon]|tara:strand:+ start:956 stop:1279 length:324 start_codon:yes stop_codon:yes gene_type:complete